LEVVIISLYGAFAIAVALAMCASGTMKLVRPRRSAKWRNWRGGGLPIGAIKAIGSGQILGALGLILPACSHTCRGARADCGLLLLPP